MSTENIVVPDIGDAESVEVIEVMVAVGDVLELDQPVIALESEKASMDIEASVAGKVVAIHVKEGDTVATGQKLVEVKASKTSAKAPKEKAPKEEAEVVRDAAPPTAPSPQPAPQPAAAPQQMPAPTPAGQEIHAGPAVRKIAREFGIDLHQVGGSGKKGRLLKEDLQNYVRHRLSREGGEGSALPALPEVDFGKHGSVEQKATSKLEQAVARNMHRNWVNLPHVTQFDDADMTDAEALRAKLKPQATKKSLKLTPVSFLIKACAITLKEHDKFNSSLLNDGKHLVHKDYVNIGMAVDTPAGLVVPVIFDADKKDIWEIAAEITELAEKARTRKLKATDMQGGTFTVSSLGNIGGSGFTPIINAPEVAILGVSKMAMGPVWDGKKFAPRKLLPLCLSYDHRVINGGDAGRFMTDLVALLAEPKKIVAP